MIPIKSSISPTGVAALLGLLACLPCSAGAFSSRDSSDITAVCGRTSPDYVRARQADGSFVPESYAFGNGGTWAGAMVDQTIDGMNFLNVAHVIAWPLADKNYVPSKDPKAAKLLIMVYWGTTHAPQQASLTSSYDRLSSIMKSAINPPPPPGSPMAQHSKTNMQYGSPASEAEFVAVSAVAAENRMRDKDDALNASLLGYDSWWLATADYRDTPLDTFRQVMIDELENDRYFVVLMAYDFQLMWKEKKHKLLWETRFSVRQRNHNFQDDLATMAQAASKYFGQDSQGLVRTSVPFARVDIGEVKSLGEVEGAK